MYVFIIGIILIILTTVTPFSGTYTRFQHAAVTSTNTYTQPAATVLASFFSLPQKVVQLSHQLQVVEKENRKLSAQLLSCDQKIDTQIQATQSARPANTPGHSATLSYFSGDWIALPFEGVRLQTGDLVIKDQFFVGTITTSSSLYANVEMLTGRKTPLLVVHPASKTTGLFRVEGDRPEVTFTTVVPSLKAGDMITTVPDGKHSAQSFLVGTVQENLTGPSDSTSKVRIELGTFPRVNDDVFIIGERQ